MNGDEQENTKLFDSLKTALRTQPHSFVLRFVQADGLITLLGVLSSMDYDTQQGAMHTSIIGCIKALMNNSVSLLRIISCVYTASLQIFLDYNVVILQIVCRKLKKIFK